MSCCEHELPDMREAIRCGICPLCLEDKNKELQETIKQTLGSIDVLIRKWDDDFVYVYDTAEEDFAEIAKFLESIKQTLEGKKDVSKVDS